MMTDEEHFRRLERAYSSAACNQYYAPTLTVSQGATELIIPVEDKFFHTGGAVHGAVYFKALDDAAFFAVNSLVRDVAVLTVSFTVQFVRPVSAGRLRAAGSVVHASERLFFAQSVLRDDQDQVLATGMGTFTKSRVALSPQIGYA
jgi:uncharacterized protein (TIGR00369 family)